VIEVNGDSDSTEVLVVTVNIVIAGVRLSLVKLTPTLSLGILRYRSNLGVIDLTSSRRAYLRGRRVSSR
jgi:hypothetical protein